MANNMNFVANFLRSFANLHLFQILIIISGLFNLTVCLYEDQVGKFDWLVVIFVLLPYHQIFYSKIDINFVS